MSYQAFQLNNLTRKVKTILYFFELINWGWAFQKILIVLWGIAVYRFTEIGIKRQLIRHPFSSSKLIFRGLNELILYLIYISATVGLCAIVSLFGSDEYFFKIFPLTVLISTPIVIYRLTNEIIISRYKK